jgi:hypothetical protein
MFEIIHVNQDNLHIFPLLSDEELIKVMEIKKYGQYNEFYSNSDAISSTLIDQKITKKQICADLSIGTNWLDR